VTLAARRARKDNIITILINKPHFSLDDWWCLLSIKAFRDAAALLPRLI
jgi:hypothetical protein